MMDERLIIEVQKHDIIYNRHKSNMIINGDRHASKEIAWDSVAMAIQSDGKLLLIYNV